MTNNCTNWGSGTGGFSASTASRAITTGNLYFATVLSTSSTNSINNATGLTWTPAGTKINIHTNLSMSLYWAIASASSTLSITGNGATATGIIVDEWTGHDSSGTIVQAVSSSVVTSSPGTVTLAAFSNPSNGTYATWGLHNGSAASSVASAKSGWMSVKSTLTVVAGTSFGATEFIATNDTNPTEAFSPVNTPRIGGIGVEIKALLFAGLPPNSCMLMGIGT